MTTVDKPTIETIINTTAIGLSTVGVVLMTKDGITDHIVFLKGAVLILFGAGLEYFKYWGRQRKLWGTE